LWAARVRKVATTWASDEGNGYPWPTQDPSGRCSAFASARSACPAGLMKIGHSHWPVDLAQSRLCCHGGAVPSTVRADPTPHPRPRVLSIFVPPKPSSDSIPRVRGFLSPVKWREQEREGKEGGREEEEEQEEEEGFVRGSEGDGRETPNLPGAPPRCWGLCRGKTADQLVLVHGSWARGGKTSIFLHSFLDFCRDNPAMYSPKKAYCMYPSTHFCPLPRGSCHRNAPSMDPFPCL
jgi:hypothetical protein